MSPDFLAHFVKDAHIHEIIKAQALVALLSFLEGLEQT